MNNITVCVPLKRKGKTFVMKIDYQDWQKLSHYRWHLSASGYAFRNSLGIYPRRKSIYLHREITPNYTTCHVDHINGNRLDNRQTNLRAASYPQNLHNRPCQKNNTSGYKGVWFDRRPERSAKPWVAEATFQGEKHHFGYHITAVEAARAYNVGVKALVGEFAVLNEVFDG